MKAYILFIAGNRKNGVYEYREHARGLFKNDKEAVKILKKAAALIADLYDHPKLTIFEGKRKVHHASL